MRISDARFGRDLRRYQLAHQMIRYGVRNAVIQMWTGLSAHRIRKFQLAYRGQDDRTELVRHGGTPPTNLALFMQSVRLRREAAIFGGVCQALELLPNVPVPNAAHDFPSLPRGELVCEAYEAFRSLV